MRVGLNCYDLILIYISDDHKWRLKFFERLNIFLKYRVPIVRFSLTPFWPKELKKYDKKLADRFVFVLHYFDIYGIQLVPVLHWNMACLPDFLGEPVSSWAQNNSQTWSVCYENLNLYSKILANYKNLILDFELGNEVNTFADIQSANITLPVISVKNGTPSYRSSKDLIIGDVLDDLLRQVKNFNNESPLKIRIGFDLPRPTRWIGEFRKHFDNIFDDGDNMKNGVGIHLYSDRISRYQEFGFDIFDEISLGVVKRSARLTIGELGVPFYWRLDVEEATSNVHGLLDACEEINAEYALLWVFDFDWQKNSWSFSVENNMWMLDIILKRCCKY